MGGIGNSLLARGAYAAAALGCAAACSGPATPADGTPASAGTVHVLGSPQYFADDFRQRFENSTGIRLVLDPAESNAVLEARLMVGNAGYDVVFPSAGFLTRHIPAGVYQPLDKSRLPNLARLDPTDLRRLEIYDPGNVYGVPISMGWYGLAVDTGRVPQRLPGTRLDTLGLVFDPSLASKVADCGIGMYNSPHYITQLVYLYLGLDPASESPDDVLRIEATLRAARPYVRKVDNLTTINDLAAGEVCVQILQAGEFVLARDRTLAAGRPFPYEFVVPSEGTIQTFDMVAIVADAPHPEAAHVLINFLFEPGVHAANAVAFAAPVMVGDARAWVPNEQLQDPAIYPPDEVVALFHLDRMPSAGITRARTRAWSTFFSNNYR
jgi:putrescine transport system substrate-binding protein